VAQLEATAEDVQQAPRQLDDEHSLAALQVAPAPSTSDARGSANEIATSARRTRAEEPQMAQWEATAEDAQQAPRQLDDEHWLAALQVAPAPSTATQEVPLTK